MKDTTFFYRDGEKTLEEKKRAHADYHAEYRKDELNAEYYEALYLLRDTIRYGRVTLTTRTQLLEICGCSYEFLIQHLGLNNEYVLNAFRLGEYEIDHLFPKKFFKENPEFRHYTNNWRNFVVTRKSDNRTKSSKMDYDNPAVAMLLVRMKRELLEAQVDASFPDPIERAQAYQYIFN